jgi:hypothetical protein
MRFTSLPFLLGPGREAGAFISEDAGNFPQALVKLLLRGARVRFRVNLPGQVSETNGQRETPTTVAWDWRMDELGYEALRNGQTAVFDARGVSFGLPSEDAEFLEQLRGVLRNAGMPVKPEAELPKGFRVRLNSMELRRKTAVGAGETEGELGVELAVTVPRGFKPAYAESALIERATTDAGEVLALATEGRIDVRTIGRQEDGGWPEARPSFVLTAPAAGSTTLTALKGKFTLACSTGTKEVRIAPLSAWVGRQIEDPALGGVAVHLEKVAPHGVLIRCDDANVFEEVSFESESGTRIDCSHSSARTSEQETRVTYYVDVPLEGAMILKVHQDLKKCTIPFSFTDIALP